MCGRSKSPPSRRCSRRSRAPSPGRNKPHWKPRFKQRAIATKQKAGGNAGFFVGRACSLVIGLVIRGDGVVADGIDPERIVTRQQRASLGLVIRGDVVVGLHRLGEDSAIILIIGLGADEDADAVVRLGIEIAHLVAVFVNHEAVRRQRVHRLLARGIVGDLDPESGRRQIETVLVEKWLARRFQRRQQRGAQQQCDRRDGTERLAMQEAK